MKSQHKQISALLGAAVLLTASCVTLQDTGGEYLISSKNTTKINPRKPYELVKGVRFIPLSSDSASLFYRIEQAIMTENSIFLRATLSFGSGIAHIFEYRHDGSFVRKIGGVGNGPGEYHTVESMIIRDDTIKAFDNGNKRILYYNVHTGKYLGATSFSHCSELTFMNTVLDIPGSPKYLVSSDVAFDRHPFEIGTWTPGADSVQVISPARFTVEGYISYSNGSPTISAYNDDYAFAILPLDPRIYKINFNDLSITKFAKLEDGHPMPDFQPGMNYDIALRMAIKEHALSPSSIYVTPDYIVTNNFTQNSYIWDIAHSKGYRVPCFFDLKMKGEFPFLPNNAVGTTPDGRLICAFDADDFLNYCSTLKHDARFRPGDISNIDDESNQVLVIYDLKN